MASKRKRRLRIGEYRYPRPTKASAFKALVRSRGKPKANVTLPKVKKDLPNGNH
jgi:hypothetical protein